MPVRLIRYAAVTLVAVLALWASVGVTLTHTLGRQRSAVALAWWPQGARTKAAAANTLLEGKPSPAQRAEATALATAALEREPVNLEAARALGIARAYTSQAAARGAFRYAERLSRRDLFTEMWQIEDAVGRDDVAGALKHYDRALRTTGRAEGVLLPTLAAAADDPVIARGLAPYLARRPAWWRAFMLRAIQDSRNAATLSALVLSSRMDLSGSEDLDIARLAVARIVDGKRYAIADQLHRRLLPAAVPLLRDGGFENGGVFAPFDWVLADGSGLSATRENYAPGDTRLTVRAGNGASGEVARQMLLLRPGRYELAGMVGDTSSADAAAPSVELHCVDAQKFVGASLPRAGDRPTRFRTVFVVPANYCRAQWLFITMPAQDINGYWIDQLTVAPAPNARSAVTGR